MQRMNMRSEGGQYTSHRKFLDLAHKTSSVCSISAISPPSSNGCEIHFVQVKSNSTGGFLKKLKDWREKHKVKEVKWLLMVRMDARKSKSKWKIYR